jgi:hypothetical protein
MKTKMFFSLMVAAFLSLQVVSATDKTEASGKSDAISNVRSKIITALNNVTFSEGGSVYIYISTNSDTKTLAYRVEGSDKDLVSEVKYKIQSIKLQAPENFVGNYRLKVNFVDAFSNAAGLVASR